MDEPTIYEYLMSLFDPDLHFDLPSSKKKIKTGKSKSISNKSTALKFIVGCIFAFFGQIFLEPSHRNTIVSIVCYIISAFVIIRNSTLVYSKQKRIAENNKEIKIKIPFLVFSIILLIGAFILFSDNKFSLLNVFLWISGVIFLYLSLRSKAGAKQNARSQIDRMFFFALIVVIISSLFMRIYLFSEVPGEMYSDHAEKLLDVMDILDGEYSIFFERNTGREPIQFYITALIEKIFHIGLKYESLKIGTIFFGLLTLPYIYLLAKYLGNKWIGLASVFLVGVAYWPNVISRVGLRYALYPLFTAPVLYYLFKGIRENDVNALLKCGIFTGLGLLGYSSFRIVPLFIIITILIQYMIQKEKQKKLFLINSLIIIGLISLSIFLPLARYWFDNPGSLSYRSLTRLTQIERSFDEPAIWIFIKNTITSLLMPFVNNGHIWVHSIPNRPALDQFTGALYFIGLFSMGKDLKKSRNTEMLLLFISIFFLMLPSILSLAYPGENPSLNRSAAAYIPIFIFAGFGFYNLIYSIRSLFIQPMQLVISFSIILLIGVGVWLQNYNLVFEEYSQQFFENAWNTSEIGQVIADYLELDNKNRNAYVIPYPHWVDTRLVGFNANFPGKDFALWRDDIEQMTIGLENGLFIYKPEDFETESILENLWPSGRKSVYYSKILGKEFFLYTVLED